MYIYRDNFLNKNYKEASLKNIMFDYVLILYRFKYCIEIMIVNYSTSNESY